MSAAYYICGQCGQRLSFGRPLYEHRCSAADPGLETAPERP